MVAVKTRMNNRTAWLAVGIVVGLSISYLWPHEPAYATATDRNENFAIVTAESGLGGADAVFVLDFLTGRLVGAALSSQSGQFTQFYLYNVAGDFQVDPDSKPYYAIVSGRADLPRRGQANPAASVLYIAELTSGRVNAYGFPYQIANRRGQAAAPVPLVPVDSFKFRDAMGG